MRRDSGIWERAIGTAVVEMARYGFFEPDVRLHVIPRQLFERTYLAVTTDMADTSLSGIVASHNAFLSVLADAEHGIVTEGAYIRRWRTGRVERIVLISESAESEIEGPRERLRYVAHELGHAWAADHATPLLPFTRLEDEMLHIEHTYNELRKRIERCMPAESGIGEMPRMLMTRDKAFRPRQSLLLVKERVKEHVRREEERHAYADIAKRLLELKRPSYPANLPERIRASIDGRKQREREELEKMAGQKGLNPHDAATIRESLEMLDGLLRTYERRETALHADARAARLLDEGFATYIEELVVGTRTEGRRPSGSYATAAMHPYHHGVRFFQSIGDPARVKEILSDKGTTLPTFFNLFVHKTEAPTYRPPSPLVRGISMLSTKRWLSSLNRS